MAADDDNTRAYGDKGETTCAYGEEPLPDGGIPGYDRKSVQAERAVRDWKTGDVILDLYEVKDILGRGGFGTVHKVRHRLWNRELAVKSLNTECALSGDYKEAFIRECLGWVNLGLHPHIVSCYYVREIDGLPRIFSEYVDGGTLDDYIDRGNPGGWKHILELSLHCLEGLAFAHHKGIIHRDIKPQNCLLTKEGTLKITDFGIASGISGMLPLIRTAPTDGTLAMTMAVHGQAVGTKEYMPPEQWDSSYGEIGPWTDLYAFGSMLFQICCGELLFNDGNDPPEIVRVRHLSVEPPDPVTIREDIPLKLSRFILKCLEKKPEQRYRSSQDACKALIEVYGEVTGEPYQAGFVEEASLLADGLNNRAVSLIDLGKKDEAMNLWKEALGLESHHPESIYNRGVTEWHEGKITDGDLIIALEEMRKSHKAEWIDEYLTSLVHIEAMNQEAALELLDCAIEGGAGEEARAAREAAAHMSDRGARLVKTFEGHKIVFSAAFSPSGDFCLSGGSEGSLLLHEVATGKIIRSYKAHTLHIQHVAFSPDGAFATSGGADGLICRWNVKTGECIYRIEMKDSSGYDNANRGEYTSAITVDGRFVLAWNGPENLELYDMTTGACVKRQTQRGLRASILSLSADGSRALLLRDKAVMVWNVQSMSPDRTFSDRNYGTPGTFGNEGRLALWCGDTFKNDYAFYLWDIEKGEQIRSFKPHRGAPSAFLAATKECRYVLSGNRRTICLLEMNSGCVLRTFTITGGTGRFIALSYDERLFLSDGSDGKLYLWNISPLYDRKTHYRAPLALSSVRSTEEITETKSRYDSLLSKAREALQKECYGNALALAREARALKGYHTLKDALDIYWEAGLYGRKKGFSDAWQVRVFSEKTGDISFCAASTRALSGGLSVRLWDVETGTCMKTYAAPGGSGYRTFWRPFHDTILVGTNEGTVYVIHASSGEKVHAFSLPPNSFNHVSLHPDDSRLLLAGADGVLRLWDLESSTVTATMKTPHQILFSAACSGNGRIAAVGGNDDSTQWDNDNAITVWNLTIGHCIRTLNGHRKKVWAMALNFDGSRLCSGGGDGLVKVWDTTTGRCVRVMEGHGANIRALALTRCGDYLFSGSDDHTIRLWNVSTGQCLRTFSGHPCQVISLSLTADSRFLLSGDYQGESRLWEMEWDFEDVEPRNWDNRALPYVSAFIEHRGSCGISVQDGDSLKELEEYLKHHGFGWIRAGEVRKKAVQVSREVDARSRKAGNHSKGSDGIAASTSNSEIPPKGISCMVLVIILCIILWAMLAM